MTYDFPISVFRWQPGYNDLRIRCGNGLDTLRRRWHYKERRALVSIKSLNKKLGLLTILMRCAIEGIGLNAIPHFRVSQNPNTVVGEFHQILNR